ncbi:MAG TPA: hypothetical protein VNA22_07460 [Pyrinomonadaceae bacterium]|nr:hypothetical protein [Pyrinomonadaceae bacterium]
MSYVRFNISDRDRTIHGDLHGSFTDPLIASLTAEPETIDEFKTALERFIKADSDWPLLHDFRTPENLEPYDAGVVAIDLASRTVGYESTYAHPGRDGSVRVPEEFSEDGENIYIPYRLPDDWMFIGCMAMYEGTSSMRREKRLQRPAIDARSVLYGRPMLEHLVRGIAGAPDLGDEELFADIHASWLMTKRADLAGASPRDMLFEKRDFIDFDLHARSLQWSFTKVCPPGLSKESAAYQNAGFGTHEWVLYYDLVRYLLTDTFGRQASQDVELDSEVARLTAMRDNWLHTPDSESWGRLPIEVIDLERRRVNMTATAAEILIDENCPCCVALAEDFDNPMFTHLDGCNMDDRFEFSPFKTIEEYEAEQRRYEEFSREFREKRKDDPEYSWLQAGEEPF